MAPCQPTYEDDDDDDALLNVYVDDDAEQLFWHVSRYDQQNFVANIWTVQWQFDYINIIIVLFDSSVRGKAAYEGEGKTTVKVLNQDYELGLMIDAYATVTY